MKIKEIIYFSLLSILLAATSCSDQSSVTVPENSQTLNGDIEQYVSKEGMSYEFIVDTLNSSTQNFDNIGKREVEIEGTQTIDGLQYFKYSENYKMSEDNFSLESLMRVTDNSIIVYADTSGVSLFIPDSLKETIKLEIDKELLIFKLPLEIDEEWHVFKGSANFGAFRFKVFDVSAKYIGPEQILVEDSTQVTAEKVEYKIELNIPDIENPFVSNVKTVYANLWFVEGKGIVKMEGSTWLIKPLTGFAFSFSDQNTIIRHNLTSEK